MGFEGILMAAFFHKELMAGHYRTVVEQLLDRAPKTKRTERDATSLIAALSFLGRLEEAEILFARLEKDRAALPALVASRFFLGIGYTRKSEYSKAESIFAKNENSSSPKDPAFVRFFVIQGRVFLSYYRGRVEEALLDAEKSRRAALRSGDLFARSLATDALGHCRVMNGEIHHGLRLLGEARELADRLGNHGLANSIAISCELYEAEFGLGGPTTLEKLEGRWNAVGTEDSYSLSNVGLELSRQYTRFGRFEDAGKVLETVAPKIYSHQNRRQEISLDLRLAELAYRRGDFFGARHNLRYLRRLLHNEADSSFELAALGMERKLAQAEGKEDEVKRLTKLWRKLSKGHSNIRDTNLAVREELASAENREDRIHQMLQNSKLGANLEEKLEPLLKQNSLADAVAVLGVKAGQEALVFLPSSLGFLVQTHSRISRGEPLSPLQIKILSLLKRTDCDKEKLVQFAWGYRYDPLRHDPMVYSAMSSLRKHLGDAAQWLRATEHGYSFVGEMIWVAKAPRLEQKPQPSSPPPASPQDPLTATLNFRQQEILEWMREKRYIAVGECRERFKVSEITALRDLADLRERKLVIRMGKARATRYTLVSVNGGAALE